MAQARMLRKDICESDSFAELNNSDAQLLLCLLTSWWTDWGKMIGEPEWIKGNIVRKLKQFTKKRIIRCLNLINLHTDVHFWTDKKGNRWLYWPKFDIHQSISKEKKAKDLYPYPKIPKNPQENPATREVNIREVNISNTTTSPEVGISHFLTLWNEKMIWKIRNITKERRIHLLERIKEPSFKDDYNILLQKILDSDFLSGRKPSKEHPNFKADFDWIIKNSTNYVKILEGKYDNKIQDKISETRKKLGLKEE